MKPSGITFQYTDKQGNRLTTMTPYENLERVSAVALWKGCEPGTMEVTFAYGTGLDRLLRVYIVSAETFAVIRGCLQRDIAQGVVLKDETATRGATYSLFADIVGALFGADKANTMHREFAIWSDNLDKIIETSIKAAKAPDRVIVVDDGQVRNPEVEKMMAHGLTMFPRNIRFASGGLVPAAPPAPPTRYVRDDAAPEFPSVIDRMRKQLHAQSKPDIAPNTMREFLVDFISHSEMVREALQERRHKADESDKLLQTTTAATWNHEIYTHSEMVIAAHRLLKVIP